MHKMVDDIIDAVRETALVSKQGGPFGAVVYRDGKIVGKGTNCVVGSHDPTAHAEIVAIRNACQHLGTHDLTGCEIYATGYPCPMCMSAIIWANIRTVYYSCDYNDAKAIGFRDDHIYRFLKNDCADTDILKFVRIDACEIKKLYAAYRNSSPVIY